MTTYLSQAEFISDLLNSFKTTGKIDSKKSDEEINNYIKFLMTKQYTIINSSLSVQMQSTIFNALRNLIVIIEDFKNQLQVAFEKHENPTTAERCLEMMPFIKDLSQNLEEFDKTMDNKLLESIYKNTRILRKKARNFTFLKSIEQELKGIKLSEKEIEEFVNSYNSNMEMTLIQN